jgi:O-antigen ligase
MLGLGYKAPMLTMGLVATSYVLSLKSTTVWTAYLVVLSVLGASYFSGADTILGNSIINVSTEPLPGADGRDVRQLLEECTAELGDRSIVSGLGVGDAKPAFNQCIQKRDHELELFSFNTHNQFTSIYLMVGVLGLLFFLVQIVYVINRSMRAGDMMVLGIVMYLLIIMFSENLLEREDGVLLYAYFICFMAAHARRKQRIPKFERNTYNRVYGKG